MTSADRSSSSIINHRSLFLDLERNVVARRRSTYAGILIAFVIGAAHLVVGAAAASARAATAGATLAAAAEHLQFLADDFELREFLAVLFPAVELEPTFD